MTKCVLYTWFSAFAWHFLVASICGHKEIEQNGIITLLVSNLSKGSGKSSSLDGMKGLTVPQSFYVKPHALMS